MSSPQWFRTALAVVAILCAGSAYAQEEEVVPEIERDGAELQDMVSDPVEPPGVATALVFSNRGDQPRRVVCRALSAQGEPLGAAAVVVPAHGVRHLLAADLSNGEPFAGQATCLAGRRITASGFTASGPRLTDIPVTSKRRKKAVVIHFPIVGTR